MKPSTVRRVASPPRSQPRRWRRDRIPRQWRRGIALDPRHGPRKGTPTWWTRALRLFWAWWPWFVLSLGAALTDRWGWAFGLGAMAAICYLIAPAEASPRYGLDHEFDVESEAFLNTISGAADVPFAGGNQLAILNNGDAFYPAMLQAIASAETSVTIEAYIYWAGDIGLEFARALAAKAQQGVPVKILLDAVGSATIGSDILETLETGGCQLAWYNPIHWYTIGRVNNRTHRKSLIIDGRIGFTGGAGIADHWTGHAQSPEHWRDVQIRIEGPAVRPLQAGFAQNWLQSTGELVTGLHYYPSFDASGGLWLQTIMSSPETGASALRTMYYLSIVSARKSIWIANPYFVPDEAAVDTLIEAKRRGVDVRILVSGIRNDNWLPRHNSVRLYGGLLHAGIEVFEYNRTMLHHKLMIVDGVWATVGTTNFDNRSFAHNEESNVCFRDRALATQLAGDFERDVVASDRVELDAWRRRGILNQARELLASTLREQV
jgi:cardiolipin synthase A/B